MVSAVLCGRAAVDVVGLAATWFAVEALVLLPMSCEKQRRCDEAVAACALRARCCVVAGASLRQDSGHSEQLLSAALISMG